MTTLPIKHLTIAALTLAFLSAAEAPQFPVIITAKEAKEKYFGKSEVVFIDNRTPEKYCEGHIPGAVNLPYFAPGHPTNAMTKESLKSYAGKTLIFYCSGADRAKHAVEAARGWGIDPKKILWLKEGFPAWQKAGYPVEKTEDVCPI